MTYTQLSIVGVVGAAVLDLAVLRTRVLLLRSFWISYAIVLLFQLLTNGVLTGFGIVRYDGAAILGSSTGATGPEFFGDGRIGFAPVEDLLFGFALVVQTVAWWVFWGRVLKPLEVSEPASPGSRLAPPPRAGDARGPTPGA